MAKVEENTVEQETISPKELSLKGSNIIKNHMIVAMGFGVLPAPIVDLVGLTTTQLNMLRKLSHLYGHDFSEELAKKSIASLLGGGLTLPIAMGVSSLVKSIPIMGHLIGALSLGVTGAASTYAIGRVFTKHFESDGDFLSFNSKKVKEEFEEELEKGKEVAKKMKKETTSA